MLCVVMWQELDEMLNVMCFDVAGAGGDAECYVF